MEPSSKSQGRWPWQAIALGVGGGVSSAGLVYSATRGGVGLSTLLFVLAPLPSQIAGFGWGLGAAIVAGVAGTLVMAMIASVKVALVYVVVLALPVALITHLVLLARYDAQGTLVDWFPAGRILAAIVVYGTLLPAVLAQFGDGSYRQLEPDFQRLLKQMVEQAPAGSVMGGISDEKLTSIARLWAELMPAVVASYWTLFLAINTYLAGQVARISGHLPRPWPKLAWINYPSEMAGGLVLALIGIWYGGAARGFGIGGAGAFFVGFLFLGLSVVHAVGRARAPWLIPASYVTLVIAGYVVAPLAVLVGLAESTFGIRSRLVAKPPDLPTGTV